MCVCVVTTLYKPKLNILAFFQRFFLLCFVLNSKHNLNATGKCLLEGEIAEPGTTIFLSSSLKDCRIAVAGEEFFSVFRCEIKSLNYYLQFLDFRFFVVFKFGARGKVCLCGNLLAVSFFVCCRTIRSYKVTINTSYR